MGDLSLHFDRKEFECLDCHEAFMDMDFINRLEEARTLGGIPFQINSGYRCKKHNKEVGSTSNNHTSGRAADIQCLLGSARRLIINALIQAGFNRLGIGKTYLHVDIMDAYGSPKSYWVY